LQYSRCRFFTFSWGKDAIYNGQMAKTKSRKYWSCASGWICERWQTQSVKSKPFFLFFFIFFQKKFVILKKAVSLRPQIQILICEF